MGDVLKATMCASFEKKDSKAKTCALIRALHRDPFGLTTAKAEQGVWSFLHDLDDMVIDVPLAGVLGANILAGGWWVGGWVREIVCMCV